MVGKVGGVVELDVVILEALPPAVPIAGFDPLAVGVGDAVALVAECLGLLVELLARVDQHHPPTVTLRLLVAQQPDVGVDAGVVEELVGQHHDGVEPVVLEYPAADLALALPAVAVGQRRAVEDDRDPAATLAAARIHRLHLGQHGLQEQQRAVVGARHAGPVAGRGVAACLVLVAVLAAPGHAEGRVAEHEVETVVRAGQLVAGLLAARVVGNQGIAEEDTRLLVFLDQQVGTADGVVGRRQLLTVQRHVALHLLPFGVGPGAVEQMLLRHRQHAAGTAGGIVDGGVAGGRGDVEQFHHQADDFTRGEMLTGLLAALFREASQQLFVDVAHLQVGELVRAERQALVLVEDGGEPVVLDQLGNGGVVVEVVENVADVPGETVQIGAEVVFQQHRVFFGEAFQGVVGAVGKMRLGDLQLLHQPVELDRLRFQLRALGEHFLAHLLAPLDEHALQPADDDDRQDDVLVLVGLELATQALGGLPDLVGEVVELGFVERQHGGNPERV